MFTVPSALISSSVRNTSLPAAAALPDAAEPEAAEEEDALAQGRQILAAVGDRLTAQLHPARLHRLQTVQTAQQGAFAAAGRPHHNDDLTGLDGKADIIQNIGLAIVAFYQMVYSQDRLCHNSHFHFFSR